MREKERERECVVVVAVVVCCVTPNNDIIFNMMKVTLRQKKKKKKKKTLLTLGGSVSGQNCKSPPETKCQAPEQNSSVKPSFKAER